MISVVCVKNVSEAKKYAKLNPNYIAIFFITNGITSLESDSLNPFVIST